MLFVDTWSRPELALNLCRNVLEDPSLRPVRLVLLATIEERSHAAVQQLIDKHDLVVLVRPTTLAPPPIQPATQALRGQRKRSQSP